MRPQPGKPSDIWSQCQALPVDAAAAFHAGGRDQMEIEDAVEKAISDMPKDYILKPFPEAHRAEAGVTPVPIRGTSPFWFPIDCCFSNLIGDLCRK